MPCNSDIIQPDLSMHFHPNLDELMDLDPIAPLQVKVNETAKFRFLKGTLECSFRLLSGMSDSQRFIWNLCLIKLVCFSIQYKN